jgi:tRNA pseudouridine55 synthase
MIQGILPVHKPKSWTAFRIIPMLRKLTSIQTIGHAGTLDPFAEGIMIFLIGKKYTKFSAHFTNQSKEYVGTLCLGITTDTYDVDGKIAEQSAKIPSFTELQTALKAFQGTIWQTPPMFSAKKIQGKKLYHLARKGIQVERKPNLVTIHLTLLAYKYPFVEIRVHCSKGTYVRSIAHDLGQMLGCGAHLSALKRTKSGQLSIENCCDGSRLNDPEYNWKSYLMKWNSYPHLITSPLLQDLVD